MCSAEVVTAENIDPDNDDSQYAYGENVGWLNFEPGGSGAEVTNSAVTGYIWGENIGWIHLKNLAIPYKVKTAWTPPIPATEYTLTVTKAGTGRGTVTSNPAGINCGTDCNEVYNEGTAVTLTATPDAGSTFAGWSGDTSDGQVTMNANKT